MRSTTAGRDRLAAWGYTVSVRGGWITATGYGARHRWHGWAAVPPDGPWTGGFDGAAEPTNPGPAAYGAWLCTPLGDCAWSAAEAIGWATNNVAEWRGLLALLEAARARNARPLHVIGDSQLVVNQFTGAYAVRAPGLQPLAAAAHRLARELAVTVTWVPRARNARADALSKAALARAVPLAFDPARLAPGPRPHLVIAHGTADYHVDLRARTCTCPAFQRQRRPCKHLTAALIAPPAR